MCNLTMFRELNVLFMAPAVFVTWAIRRTFVDSVSPPAPTDTHKHTRTCHEILDFAELMQPYELLIVISELPDSVFYCVLLHCSVTLQKWQMCPRRTGTINNGAELFVSPPPSPPPVRGHSRPLSPSVRLSDVWLRGIRSVLMDAAPTPCIIIWCRVLRKLLRAQRLFASNTVGVCAALAEANLLTSRGD